MKFKLEINLENEVMQSDVDIAKALKRVALEVEAGINYYNGIIRDTNGNAVGKYEIGRG